jgi:hypothetical protein
MVQGYSFVFFRLFMIYWHFFIIQLEFELWSTMHTYMCASWRIERNQKVSDYHIYIHAYILLRIEVKSQIIKKKRKEHGKEQYINSFDWDYNTVEERKKQYDLVIYTRDILTGIIARNKIYANRCQKILTKLNILLYLDFTSQIKYE